MLSKIERPLDASKIRPMIMEDHSSGKVGGLRALLFKEEAPKEEPLEVPRVVRDEKMYDKEFARLKAWEEALLKKEAEIESLKEDVFRLAEEEGLKAGYREGWDESQKERRMLQALSSGMQKEFDELKKSLGPAALELAIHAARHIVHESCSLSIDQASRNISLVVSSFGLTPANITIKANKKTIESIKSHDPDGKICSAATFEVDNDLENSGFYISHAMGAVDSTIETRWARAMSQLGAINKYKNLSNTHDDLEEKLSRLPSSALDGGSKNV